MDEMTGRFADSYSSHMSNHLPHNWAEKTDGQKQPHKYWGGAGWATRQQEHRSEKVTPETANER